MSRNLLLTILFTCISTAAFAQDTAGLRSTVVQQGKSYLGVPYVYGGASRGGMDCSGFICTVFQEAAGLELPRTSASIYEHATQISEVEAQPGDLLFFTVYGSSRVGHVGIYLGNGQFIHAASDGPNTGVIISDLDERYWKDNYHSAGRVLGYSAALAMGTESTTARAPANPAVDTDNTSAPATPVQSPSTARTSVPVGETEAEPRPNAGGLFDRWSVTLSATADWSFFTARSFAFVPRGFSVGAGVVFEGLLVNPGVEALFSYDFTMNSLQIPLVLSLQLFKGVRVYGGPVFSVGRPVEVGTAKSSAPNHLEGAVFPGVFGVNLQTPAIPAGKVSLSLIQDIRFRVFTTTTGESLPFSNAMASGLLFSTGIRVTFPLSSFL